MAVSMEGPAILTQSLCNKPLVRDSLTRSSKRRSQAELLGEDEASRKREKVSESILSDIQMLGVDLPDYIVTKVAENYNDMTPMGRFLVETCKMQEKVPEVARSWTVSSCGATIGSSARSNPEL